MIDSIKLSALRNNEYAQFIQNFLTVVQRYDASALQVQDEYNKLLSLINSIKSMLNEGTRSAITNELITLDARRDEAINGIIALVNGYTYSKDAAKKEAANLLTSHLAGFGSGISRDAYQSETSKLEKIAADWTDKPDLAAAVATLDLTDWKTEMVAANTAFNTRYVDRSVDSGLANTNETKVYNKRPEITTAYTELREQIEAMYVVKKKIAPWSTAIAALNGVVKDYNDLLASRSTQADANNNGTATPPTL